MSDFWSKRLNNAPTQRPLDVPLERTAPSQKPMTKYSPPLTQQPQAPNRPMKSVNDAGRCPECGSGNYMKVGSIATQHGPQDAWRCYDCGYPKVQSGSGGSGVSVPSSGPTQKAIQVPTGGWNPQEIIGKLE
jgi:rubredoxin